MRDNCCESQERNRLWEVKVTNQHNDKGETKCKSLLSSGVCFKLHPQGVLSIKSIFPNLAIVFVFKFYIDTHTKKTTDILILMISVIMGNNSVITTFRPQRIKSFSTKD